MTKRAIWILLLILSGSSVFGQSGGTSAGTSGGGAGVSSIDISPASGMTRAGGPITTSGTITLAWASGAQGLVLATPCSGSGVAIFRALCAADIPALPASAITGTAVLTADSRLSHARTPVAHAATHHNGGSDECP